MIEVTYENRTPDVPYGDHFFHKETWIILAPNENYPKIILRSHNNIVFVKSTMFKSKI
jgi:hypothetical protein